MIAVIVVAAGLAFVIWRIEATLDAHAPEQEPELSWLDHADGVGCSVAMCGDPVTVHVHAGHEFWPFCEAHGTPHLTEGMTS